MPEAVTARIGDRMRMLSRYEGVRGKGDLRGISRKRH
jgi:hypothetical protein